MRYEDLKADTFREVERVVAFLNLPLDSAEIEEAIASVRTAKTGSLSTMKLVLYRSEDSFALRYALCLLSEAFTSKAFISEASYLKLSYLSF